jgi:hypothetical protein
MKNTVLGLAALLLATAPAAALDGPGRSVTASNTIELRGGPAQTSDPGGAVFNGFIPPYSGTVRLKWQVRSANGSQVTVSASVAYVSDCGEINTSSTSFVAQTCDLRVTGGYPISVRASAQADAGNTVTLRFLTLDYTVVDFDGKPIRYVAPPA